MYVYLLTDKGGKPVAVVKDQLVAEEWAKEHFSNDYMSFELDNLNLTGMKIQPPNLQQEEESIVMLKRRLQEELRNLQDQNRQLAEFKDTLSKRFKR
jgi:hypothetical protein